MTYFKKNTIEIKKSPEVNLITMLGETLRNSEESSCYSKHSFQAILNHLSKEDVENFQKPFFEVKLNNGYLHCNLIQFLFFQNFSYLFSHGTFDEKIINEALSKINTLEYPDFIKKHLSQNTRDDDRVEQTIYSTHCFFNILDDISTSFNINISEHFNKPIHFIIHPYSSSSFGFPVTTTSYREINLFTATCLRNRSLYEDLVIFGQDFKSCHDFLLFAISDINLPTFGDKTAKNYEIIQDNILHEIVNIVKETPSTKIEFFNKALLKSSFFQSLLKNKTYNQVLPSNVEFKKTFNTLNPNFYLELFNKNLNKKGFSLFNEASELHYDNIEMLNQIQELLKSKNKKFTPQDVINYLFFTAPSDQRSAKNIAIQSNNKSQGNNTSILNPNLLTDIADWLISKGDSFDPDHKFLNTIINNNKLENLIAYLDAISDSKEALLKVEEIITDLKNRVYLQSTYQHKNITNEEFTIRFEALLMEHLLNLEVPEVNKITPKAKKF